MLAENISLCILASPQALAILGIVPGLQCIALLGLVATYTRWFIGEFELACAVVHIWHILLRVPPEEK